MEPKAHCVRKSLLLDSIVSVESSPRPVTLSFILILSSCLLQGLPSRLLPSGLPTEILRAFLIYHSCYRFCPRHLLCIMIININTNNSIQLIYLRAWQQPDKANYSKALKQQ
jgi:hypothetical protein